MLGAGAGQRLSPRPGTSAEFSDFRTYVAGDDYRRLDWNAYARLDRLLLRLYLGEEDLSVHLFVDTSDSMQWGRPPKDVASRRIAGALAYVALAGQDRVAVTGFAGRVTATLRPQRGRQSCPRVWNTLGSLGSGPEAALKRPDKPEAALKRPDKPEAALTRPDKPEAALKRPDKPEAALTRPDKPEAALTRPDKGAGTFRSLLAVAGSLRPGISVILSDFLTDADLGPILAALRSARQQVVLLQILAPQELDPDVTGDVSLTDVETEARVEVTVTPALLQSYRDSLDRHTVRLTALARAHQALWHRIRSDAPLDLLLLDTFRRIGLLS